MRPFARLQICVVLALLAPAAGYCGELSGANRTRLLEAYPGHLERIEGNDLVWRDGTRMPLDDGKGDKPFEQWLDQPDIADMFAIPYPRTSAFFDKVYGDCRKGEVAKRIKAVAWLPKRGGGRLSVTTVNNVDERLAAVMKELDTLAPEMTRFLVPSAGAYNCRTILNTSRLSVHAFAAAIDINDKQADYWESLKGRAGTFVWRSRVPVAIGEIFERHGFIWGAKWYHVDSMHFEYRPELIALAKVGGK